MSDSKSSKTPEPKTVTLIRELLDVINTESVKPLSKRASFVVASAEAILTHYDAFLDMHDEIVGGQLPK